MEPVRNESQADELRRAELRKRILQQLRRPAPRFVLDGSGDAAPPEKPQAPPQHPSGPQPRVEHAKQPVATKKGQRAGVHGKQLQTPPAAARGEHAAPVAHARPATTHPAAHEPQALQSDAGQGAAGPDAQPAVRRRTVKRSAVQIAKTSGRSEDVETRGEGNIDQMQRDEAHALRIAAVRRRTRSDAQDDPAAPHDAATAVTGFASPPDEQISVERLVSPEVLNRVLLVAMAGHAGGDAVMLLGVRIAGAGALMVEIRRTGERRVRLRLRGRDAVRQRVEDELDALREALTARRLTVEEITFDA